MSFHAQHYLNNTLVQQGALITSPITTSPILGRRIEVGAVCESMKPEAWRPIITSHGSRLWEGSSLLKSYDAASSAARQHYDNSLDRALRRMFEP